MKIGTHYAYWNNMWAADYIALCHRAKKCGLDVLEVGAGDLVNMSDAELAELSTTAKELGLEISANLGPPKDKDISNADPAIREAGVKFLCDIMHQMVKIDCKILIGALYNCWPYDFKDIDKEVLWKRAVEGMQRVGDEADRLGITIALEVLNRFETLLLTDASEGVQFCRDVNRKSVKVLLDTFHMNIEEDDLPAAIRATGEWLAHLHVGEGNRKLPGMGHLDWTAIGSALKDIGFDGMVVMEPFMKTGGSVGSDIKVWRDLSGNADEEGMDRMIAESVAF
ncbi:MAG: sugar phosphate isomerase/epimerase, partial [Clostridia bacterium]|nr:sugar phosphate isomerase/epimerase [Clostridia bacterium]